MDENQENEKYRKLTVEEKKRKIDALHQELIIQRRVRREMGKHEDNESTLIKAETIKVLRKEIEDSKPKFTRFDRFLTIVLVIGWNIIFLFTIPWLGAITVVLTIFIARSYRKRRRKAVEHGSLDTPNDSN